jgi:hypothetical protein
MAKSTPDYRESEFSPLPSTNPDPEPTAPPSLRWTGVVSSRHAKLTEEAERDRRR